jgi:hypothetical protein
MAPPAEDTFVVRMVEPERALVLGDATGGMSRALVLEPIDEASTRPITRSSGAYDRLALGLLLNVFWHPVDFGMQRRQLLNLKRLAKAAACHRTGSKHAALNGKGSGLPSFSASSRSLGSIGFRSAGGLAGGARRLRSWRARWAMR